MFTKRTSLVLNSETISEDSCGTFIYKAFLENNYVVGMSFSESFVKSVSSDRYRRCILIIIDKKEYIDFPRKKIIDIISRKLNIRDNSLVVELNEKSYIFSDGELLKFSENEYLFTQNGLIFS